VGLFFRTDCLCNEFAGNLFVEALGRLCSSEFAANFLDDSPLYLNRVNFSAKHSPFVRGSARLASLVC
jgi:hypothetical protein